MKVLYCLAGASLVYCHFTSFPKSIFWFCIGVFIISRYFGNQEKSSWPLLSSRENETLTVQ